MQPLLRRSLRVQLLKRVSQEHPYPVISASRDASVQVVSLFFQDPIRMCLIILTTESPQQRQPSNTPSHKQSDKAQHRTTTATNPLLWHSQGDINMQNPDARNDYMTYALYNLAISPRYFLGLYALPTCPRPNPPGLQPTLPPIKRPPHRPPSGHGRARQMVLSHYSKQNHKAGPPRHQCESAAWPPSPHANQIAICGTKL